MSTEHWDTLKQRLDDVHAWPCEFTYKFIMPQDVVAGFVSILGEARYTTRESSKGKYTSITVVVHAQSSDEVVELYMAAARIEKVIAL